MRDYIDRMRGHDRAEIVDDEIPSRSISSIRKLAKQVCHQRAIPEDSFYNSGNHQPDVVQARNEVAYKSRLSGASWGLIGMAMGSSHSTAIRRAAAYSTDMRLPPVTVSDANERRWINRNRYKNKRLAGGQYTIDSFIYSCSIKANSGAVENICGPLGFSAGMSVSLDCQ